MNCRICNSKTALYKKNNSAANNVSLSETTPFKTNGIALNVYLCKNCNHYQIERKVADDYYDDYLMSSAYTDSIIKICNEQCTNLKHLRPNAKNIVDIGCGDGGFLMQAKKYFNSVTGYEPSKAFYTIAKKNGLDVINKYVDNKIDSTKKYDAFVSRQVFEHLDNPVTTLRTIKKILNEDSIGLIEVPNGQKILEYDRYFDIFSDHLNYFTPSSLCRLVEKLDFEVIKILTSLNDDYLEIYFRNKKKSVSKNFENNHSAFILEKVKKFKKVAIWGAGAKSQSFFTAIGGSLKPYIIIDSDTFKQGKYLPNTEVPITLPDPEKINECDLVIIFSMSYSKEITEYLQKINYSKKLMLLEPSPKILEM